MHIATRHMLVIPLAVLAVSLGACGRGPSGTASSGGSTPTTLVPVPACTGTADARSGPTPKAPSPQRSQGAAPLGPSDAAAAAEEAASGASEPFGTGEVVVVTIDGDGRPDFISVAASRAQEQVAELSAAPGVDVVAVDAVSRVSVSASASPGSADPLRVDQWGMTDLRIEDAWSIAKGRDVDIAIIDSGVSAAHVDFGTRVCSGAAYVRNTGKVVVDGGAVDGHGHGTHVAGIAAAADNGVGVIGVAPAARLIPVRVLSSDGRGYSADVARGIVWAVDHGADVINMSLGGPSSDDMAVAVDYATAHGVVVVAAAGNDGYFGLPNYPAALPDAVAVGSYTPSREISPFSTHGAFLDVAAPGSNILSTASDGRWKYMSGTSMASPHVAGLAALMIEADPSLDPARVQHRLADTAEDAGPAGFDDGFGWGIISPLAALGR